MIFILKLRETFLTKRFFQEFLSKPSVKTFSRGPAPSPKFEMWFQKRKPAQNVSLKKILSKLIGTQTLNNFYKP